MREREIHILGAKAQEFLVLKKAQQYPFWRTKKRKSFELCKQMPINQVNCYQKTKFSNMAKTIHKTKICSIQQVFPYKQRILLQKGFTITQNSIFNHKEKIKTYLVDQYTLDLPPINRPAGRPSHRTQHSPSLDKTLWIITVVVVLSIIESPFFMFFFLFFLTLQTFFNPLFLKMGCVFVSWHCLSSKSDNLHRLKTFIYQITQNFDWNVSS